MPKKIRGLRRHFRRYAAMKQQSEPLHSDLLLRNHYYHLKLGLSPWIASSFVSNPPTRFRLEAFRHLLKTYQEWQHTLAKLSEPYYAAIWLTDACFRDTQVVVGVRERIERYESLFTAAVLPTPPLPAEYRRIPGVEYLGWSAYYDELPVWPEDLPPHTPAHKYGKAATAQGEEYYLLRTGGKIWVGRQLPDESTAT